MVFKLRKLIWSKDYFYVNAGFTKSYTLTNKPNAIAIGETQRSINFKYLLTLKFELLSERSLS